jgi:hypothetical protein
VTPGKKWIVVQPVASRSTKVCVPVIVVTLQFK